MITLKRLSVVMSVFTTGLVFAACASPTDAEIAEQPAQQEDLGEETDTTSSALGEDVEDAAEEAGDDISREAEDFAEDAEDVAEDVTDEEGSVSQEQRYGYGRGHGQGGYGHGRRCDYRNVRHCIRHHRGWRWVDVGRGYGRGHGRYGDHYGRGRSNYCCMRVHIRDHRGPRPY